MDNDYEKKIALLDFLDIDDEVEREEALKYAFDVKDNYFTYESKKYLILTEEEADVEIEKIERDLLEQSEWYSNIPNYAKSYFNDKEYIEQEVNDADYGSLLASEDSEQNEIKIDETWYYIYRQS